VIKNFEEAKKQLSELAEVVNAFKSEQVQLRIVDALLGNLISGGAAAANPPEPEAQRSPPPKKRAAKKSTGKANGEGGSGKSSARKSPKTAIEDLVGENYFAQRRNISEVTEYLKVNRALNFSNGALQMALNRLVQNKQMQRGKNAESQFEYFK
jgi:hypothetical protein